MKTTLLIVTRSSKIKLPMMHSYVERAGQRTKIQFTRKTKQEEFWRTMRVVPMEEKDNGITCIGARGKLKKTY